MAAVLIAVRPVSAQRIDLSAGISKVAFIGEGRTPFAPGAGMTVHFSPRHAVQLTTDVTYDAGPGASELDVIYSVQYRHAFARHDQWLGFVTVGAAGAAERNHINNPARTHSHVYPPAVPVVGGGAEYRIGRHVAWRADLTFGIGPSAAIVVRAAVGGVIRLGSERVTK